jgi:hydrogenase maturation protein HypF
VGELFDPRSRRYHYPFISCTKCGPRFSICERLPFDRERTALKTFSLCSECHSEYTDPANRRFHAQTISCRVCGPEIWGSDSSGRIIERGYEAIIKAQAILLQDGIVAVKGISGIHLVCNAASAKAITRLRFLKRRKTKPFAVMYPDINEVDRFCILSRLERDLLESAAAPIVIINKRQKAYSELFMPLDHIAPGHNNLGVLLPYTPIYHLLLNELRFALVVTSANISNERLLSTNSKVLDLFNQSVDLFLLHNMDIVNSCDDSVMQIVADRTMPIRLGRGCAPLTWVLGHHSVDNVIGIGGWQKNAVSILHKNHITLSQFIGDIDSIDNRLEQERVINKLMADFDCNDNDIAAVYDMHPDSAYNDKLSDQTAMHVQHHYAHAMACIAENNVDLPCLAITWDGTGFGSDATIWGGEGLLITSSYFERKFHLLPFPLIGGDLAIKAVNRIAMSLLFVTDESLALNHDLWRSHRDGNLLKVALRNGINVPVCTSMGRLFDGVAALLGLCIQSTYEGEAAYILQSCAESNRECIEGHYDFSIIDDVIIDWRVMILQILADQAGAIAVSVIAAKFHNTLVRMILEMVHRSGMARVVLTGGCFQNKLLMERSLLHLHRMGGVQPYWSNKIPCNDSGLAVGQIFAVCV